MTQEAPPTAPAEPVHLTANERVALRCLDQAMKAGETLATGFDDGVECKVVRKANWRAWFYREGKPGVDQKTKEKAFRRAVDSLLSVRPRTN